MPSSELEIECSSLDWTFVILIINVNSDWKQGRKETMKTGKLSWFRNKAEPSANEKGAKACKLKRISDCYLWRHADAFPHWWDASSCFCPLIAWGSDLCDDFQNREDRVPGRLCKTTFNIKLSMVIIYWFVHFKKLHFCNMKSHYKAIARRW